MANTQRTLDLHYDKLIIGADYSALHFALYNDCPIAFINLKRPNQFSEKLSEYNDFLFQLSFIHNLTPFSNLIQSIRLDEEDKLKITTKNNLVVTVTYNKLFISDDDGVEGLPVPIGKTDTKCLVLDYLDIISGSNKDIKEIKKDNCRLIFYKSATNGLDLVCETVIEEKDLNEFEYSESANRLKAIKLMKENGFKGRYDKTNDNYKPIILLSQKRLIFPFGKNIYDSLPNNIEMLY